MLRIYHGFECNLTSDSFREMLVARKKTFVDEYGWDLDVSPQGFEVDQYDTEDATYVMQCGEGGRHAASLRILPTSKSTMLFDHFTELSSGVEKSKQSWEVTRFISSAAQSRARNAARLMWAGYMLAILSRIKKIISITDQNIARQMRACGSRPRVIASMNYGTEKILSCEWDSANCFSDRLLKIAGMHYSEITEQIGYINSHALSVMRRQSDDLISENHDQLEVS